MKKILFTSVFLLSLILIPCSMALANENNTDLTKQEYQSVNYLNENEFGPLALINQRTYTISSNYATRSFNFITNTGQLRAEFLNTSAGLTAYLYRSNGSIISGRSISSGGSSTKNLVWTAVPRGEPLYLEIYSYASSDTVTLRVHDQ